MKADLNACFGLNQRRTDLPSAYRNPSDQELVGVSLRIPILDWGLSESEYKLAQMQKRAEDAQIEQEEIEQEEIDIRESVILTVKEFHLKYAIIPLTIN